MALLTSEPCAWVRDWRGDTCGGALMDQRGSRAFGEVRESVIFDQRCGEQRSTAADHALERERLVDVETPDHDVAVLYLVG